MSSLHEKPRLQRGDARIFQLEETSITKLSTTSGLKRMLLMI